MQFQKKKPTLTQRTLNKNRLKKIKKNLKNKKLKLKGTTDYLFFLLFMED
jgi:hypothetical protein